MSKNQRLNATITIGSVLEQSVKRNMGFLKSGLSQVGDAIKGVERRQKELDRQRNVLRKQGQSVEHLDREYEKLERTLVDLRRAQERWNRAAAASRRVGSTFSNMASGIGRNARQIAIGATLAGGAIFGLANSTADLGDNVAKTADKLGIGLGALQELRYAAERSGVATGTFDGALEKMTKNIGLALEGTGAQKDALDALGLSAGQLANQLPEEALASIADKLQGVETQAEKAALANDLFGRSGIGLLNMLKDGSKGLTQLREDARRTGYVLSDQAARDAEVFKDTLLDTQLVMAGLKNTVGSALMPVVTRSMRRIGDALIGNRADVERWANGFADGAERALPVIGEIASGIGAIGSVVWSVTEGTADMIGGWENFGMVVGAVLASRTIVRVAKFGGAVFSLGRAMLSLATASPIVVGAIRAIGSALVMNPIGAAIAVIAGGAYLIYRNWESVAPWFKGLWGDAKGYFQGFGNFVGGVFTGDMERAEKGVRAMWDGTTSFFDRTLSGIGAVFSATYSNLIKPVTDAMGITGPIEAAWRQAGSVLGPVLSDIGSYYSGLGDVVAGAFSGDMQRASDGLGRMWKSARSVMDGILGGIGDRFRWIYDNVIKPVTDAMGLTAPIERAWSTLSGAIDTTLSAIGSVFDTTWSGLVKPVIDGLAATGGIGAAWEAVKTAIDPVLTWIGDKFTTLMTLIKPVIEALKWGYENAQRAGNAIGSAVGSAVATRVEPSKASGLGNTASNDNAAPMTSSAAEKLYGIKPQKNALGGPFRPGWHLTGELGPELKFENRSGYVANNRAMRQLAGYAERVGSVFSPAARSVKKQGARVLDMVRGSGGVARPVSNRGVMPDNLGRGSPRVSIPAQPARRSSSAARPVSGRGARVLDKLRRSSPRVGIPAQPARRMGSAPLTSSERSQSRRPDVDGMMARIEAAFSQTAAPALAAAPAQASQTVTNHYTINAPGADAHEVLRLLKREEQRNAGNGLFDRAPATGPFGR